jgi:hypothetical protein
MGNTYVSLVAFHHAEDGAVGWATVLGFTVIAIRLASFVGVSAVTGPSSLAVLNALCILSLVIWARTQDV